MRVDGENARLLAFHSAAQQMVPEGGVMLEFGGGPTLYQLISAADRAREIHFSEHLSVNRREIQAWLDDDDGAFSWRAFTAAVLELEGGEANEAAVAAREALLRQRITRVLPGNAFEVNPLGDHVGYDVVSVNFVMEGITDNLNDWHAAFSNVTGMVSPEGYFISTVVTGAEYWRSGEHKFPAVSLDADALCAVLGELGFEIVHLETLEADDIDPDSPGYEGYTGMAMLVAKRCLPAGPFFV